MSLCTVPKVYNKDIIRILMLSFSGIVITVEFHFEGACGGYKNSYWHYVENRTIPGRTAISLL